MIRELLAEIDRLKVELRRMELRVERSRTARSNMNWLFELCLKALIPIEKEPEIMWYRIDRITSIDPSKHCIQVEYGVDAICAATPYDALAIASVRNSLKHGQLFQPVFCNTQKDHQRAVAIGQARDAEIAEFESLMQSVVNGKAYHALRE